ncbi:hypothetical protein LEMLEM_LOCUS23101 [Lemmus lemmus]
MSLKGSSPRLLLLHTPPRLSCSSAIRSRQPTAPPPRHTHTHTRARTHTHTLLTHRPPSPLKTLLLSVESRLLPSKRSFQVILETKGPDNAFEGPDTVKLDDCELNPWKWEPKQSCSCVSCLRRLRMKLKRPTNTKQWKG